MFEVKHEDDAWELGVLLARGFVSGSTEELGVPEPLEKFFFAGCHDHHALSDERVENIAMGWGLPAPDRELRLENN